LRRYRDAPTAAKAERLRRGFDKLFQQTTGYTALDKRIAITRQKRQSLLRVLEHPELPLHNNPAELGARQRVRKRDISFGPRSDAGMRAQWGSLPRGLTGSHASPAPRRLPAVL
jgi:hypothetical protein